MNDQLRAKKDDSLNASIRVFDDQSITLWLIDKEENMVGPIYTIGQPNQVNQQVGSFIYEKSSGLNEKQYVAFMLSLLNINN